MSKIPYRDHSRFASNALAAPLDERGAALIRACEIANQDPQVAEIEKELDGLAGEMPGLPQAEAHDGFEVKGLGEEVDHGEVGDLVASGD